jgi:hypothetical protein
MGGRGHRLKELAMLVTVTVTPALAAWISSRHDPGQPPLRIRPLGAGLSLIERADGSPLSASEAAHVRGVLAAHAAEEIVTPPAKKS